MNNTYFSIVIPTFNNKSGVYDLVKHLLKIQYDNYEIIVIIDGSTDNTKESLQNIKNKKLKIVYQPNLGVSASRNNGLKLAKGDYVLFFDDDDTVALNILEKLNEYVKNNNSPDIIRYTGTRINKDGQIEYLRPMDNNINPLDQIIYTKNKLECYVWLLAIKRTGIIPFRENLKYLEDDVFIIENFLRPNIKVLSITEQLYNYNYNNCSKTKNPNNLLNNIDDLIEAGIAMMSIQALASKYKKYIKANITNMIFWRYEDAKLLSGEKLAKQIANKGTAGLQKNNLVPSLTTPKVYLKYLNLLLMSKIITINT